MKLHTEISALNPQTKQTPMKTKPVTAPNSVECYASRVSRGLCLALLAILAFVLAPAAWADTQTYTNGSGNWTVPAGVTSVTVELWGGGGGGGGLNTSPPPGSLCAAYPYAVSCMCGKNKDCANKEPCKLASDGFYRCGGVV